MALTKIKEQLDEMDTRPPPQCSAGPKGSDMYQWMAKINGPPDTPFQGGVFNLDITFPSNYPASAPSVTFTTKIFHPNISTGGSICLATIRSKWNSSITIAKVLQSIIFLLMVPNADDPYNSEAAELWKHNRAEYNRRARSLTAQYAR